MQAIHGIAGKCGLCFTRFGPVVGIDYKYAVPWRCTTCIAGCVFIDFDLLIDEQIDPRIFMYNHRSRNQIGPTPGGWPTSNRKK